MKKLTFILTFSSLLFISCDKKKQVAKAQINEIKSELFCFEKPASIGETNGVEFFEGGFSGLYYDKNEDIFYTITDRGPNLKHKVDSISEEVKIFPFPEYQQKIIQLKVEGKKLKEIETIPLFDVDNKAINGLPLAESEAKNKEIAWLSVKGEHIENSIFAADFEAIAKDKNGDYWVTDEYQTSIWKFSPEGVVLQKFTPQASIAEERNGVLIDSIFSYRKPNRGFEGLSLTPKGQVWAMLQSPLWLPSKEKTKNSRLVRILHLDPTTNQTKTYLYEFSNQEGIRTKDWKIGDLYAISETEFLVIEHATYKENKSMKVFKFDVSEATDLSNFYNLNKFYPEELNNENEANRKGVILAKKTLILDLVEIGFDDSHSKPEGLTMVDYSTLVVANDNDYAIEFDMDKKAYINNQTKSCFYFFYLPKSIFDY